MSGEETLVCAACRTVSCWEGVLMCEDAGRAGTSIVIEKLLPLGFKHVNVTVTAAEYRALRHQARQLHSGQVGMALRKMAGLPEEPHGLMTALDRQTANREK